MQAFCIIAPTHNALVSDDLTAPFASLNLNKCKGLESLHIFVSVDDDTADEAYATSYWDVANAILASLPESVQHITLCLEATVHQDDLREVLMYTEWDKQVRAYERLPNLQSVTFSGGVRGRSDRYKLDPQISSLIALYLGAIASRGIVQFY